MPVSSVVRIKTYRRGGPDGKRGESDGPCSRHVGAWVAVILEHHWILWAIRARGEAGQEVGYPRQVPWYTPPKRPGDDPPGDREMMPRETPQDEDIADQIGRAVHELSKIRPQMAAALKAHWGAYPRPAHTMEARCRKMRVSRQYCVEARDSARYWCEALVERRMGLASSA